MSAPTGFCADSCLDARRAAGKAACWRQERQSLEYYFDSSTAGHDWKTVPVIIYMFLFRTYSCALRQIDRQGS
jgi:hypothetical protein